MGWQFDGTSDYVELDDNAGLTLPDGDWHVAVWIKPDLSGSSLRTICQWGTTNADPSFRLKYSDQGYALSNGLLFDVQDSDIGDEATKYGASVLGASNTWQFILMERSGSTFTMYVDNVSKLTETDSAVDAVNVSATFLIGCDETIGQFFKGTMAELAVWSDADSDRKAALAGGASYDDYTTNRTQYISMRNGYTEEDQGATVTNHGTTESTSDHPPVVTYLTVPILTTGTIYAPTSVTPDSVTITVPLLTAGTAYAPSSVTPDPVTVTLPLLNAGTIFAPDSVTSAQVLTVPLLTASGLLTPDSVMGGIELPLLTAGTLYTPDTLNQGSILTVPLLTAGTLYTPDTLNQGSILTVPLLTAGTLYAPSSVITSITVPLLTAGTLYTPSKVTGGSSFQFVTPQSTSDFSLSTPQSTTDFIIDTPQSTDDFTESS